MRKTVEKLFADHGTDMIISGASEVKRVRGFFRAVNPTSWQSMESESMILGEITRGQYRYIGPAGVAVEEGDTIKAGNKHYLVRRVEPYFYENETIYLWAACVEKGVNDIWGIQS